MMLRHLGLIVAIVLAPSVQAQTARVSSGDHADFTRIVVEYGSAANWMMGRTADGYEIRLDTGTAQYDLSKVFDLIGKDRLAAIWADPVDGRLHFSIACACFAMPFEFRPGTVVIDIRDGQPPKGSSFEFPLDGGTVADLAPAPVVRPMKRPAAKNADGGQVLGYDWTAALLEPSQPVDNPAFAPAAAIQFDLDPLRQSLIEELSLGASQGIVDMANPRKVATAEGAGNPSVEIRLSDEPNLLIRQKGEQAPPLTAEGAECIAPEALDIASWAEEAPIVDQIGPVNSGLTGEFDLPDPEAIKRAVRFYLHIGFGAEARALLRAFPTEQADAAIWQSMARILDEERDPEPTFGGMAACDSPAALWAVLSDDNPPPDQIQKVAVLRAFSALPANLRYQLGPGLVDKFLAMRDFSTAIALRDAALRGTSELGPEAALMQAAIEKAGDSPSASEALLEEVVTDSGPHTAEALAKLVVQRAELGQEVTFEQVESLEGYSLEQEGGPREAEFAHALTLGYAASGDFEQARERITHDPEAAPVFWKILATSAPESALLNIATLPKAEQPPLAASASASLIATRMLDLGLADQAARWLDLAEAPPVLLGARINLARGRAREAYDAVQNDTSPTGFQLKAEALRQLGDERALSDLFETAGMIEDRSRALSRLQDWQALAAAGPEIWQVAAQTVTEPTDPVSTDPTALPPGPLAESRALLESSSSTRSAINALLEGVKSPTMLTQ